MRRLYWVSPLTLQLLFRVPVRLMFNFFCGFEVHNLENVKISKTHGVIFAANHTSELDPVFIAAALPLISRHTPLFFATDEPKLFKKNKFGWRSYIYQHPLFFEAFGGYPVYVGKHNFEKSLVHHIDLLQKNRSVVYFPEGLLSRSGVIGEAKPGIGFLLHRAKVIVIPVAISGAHEMSVKKFFLRKTKVRIFFGVPIQAEDIWNGKVVFRPTDFFKEGAERVMCRIKTFLQ